MTIDWNRLLRPEQIECIARTRAQLVRLHGLPDRWLAVALMKLARDCRSLYPEDLPVPANDRGGTYDNNLVWNLVPEIAYRLGHREFQTNERRDPRYASASLPELREVTGIYLAHSSRECGTKETRPAQPAIDPWRLLLHEAVNGNPLAIALDRLCPPTADMTDRLVSALREISHNRGLPADIWSPEWDAACRANAKRPARLPQQDDVMPTVKTERPAAVIAFMEKMAARAKRLEGQRDAGPALDT